jgi:hypothetical protein
MSDNARLAAIGGVGIVLAYWALVIGVRNAFGVHLPDPGDFLPQEWRSYLP